MLILLTTMLLSQIELEIPQDVFIGDRITLQLSSDEYDNFVWNVKRINIDGGKVKLEDVEETALRIFGSSADFTTKLPGTYRFFVSAGNADEVVQAVGVLHLDYYRDFVTPKKEITFIPELPQKDDEVIDVGDQMPTSISDLELNNEDTVEGQITKYTKEVLDYRRSKNEIANMFREKAELLESGRIKETGLLASIHREARSLPDSRNWEPWFKNMSILLREYHEQGVIERISDWVSVLRGISATMYDIQ